MAEMENSKDLISVLWSGADILRSKMDANEYKNYLLGIIFYKYLSDDERQKDLEQKKGELDEIISETKQEEEKLRDKAKDLETKIEPRLLQSFKRIRKNSRNGLGIVYVQRDACGGCFNKIPPQRQLDIRSRKKVIVCEYCGRIMIDPELAGIQIEHKVEEAPAPTTKRAIRRKTAE